LQQERRWFIEPEWVSGTILIIMVWFSLASGLNRRRKTQQLRNDAMASVASPEASHPALGLGGRSIELSISAGRELDPEAFDLAAAELHGHILSEDVPTAELLEDARWLVSLSVADGVPPTTRTQVEQDMEALGGQTESS
jgi:hypothetical protein